MKSKIEKLEMLRGLAAMYVVAHHLVLHAFPLNRVLNFLLRFGQEAVMAFFLLSGFVVYYSTHQHRDQSFRGYFRRRFTRIYPIFLIALVLSYGMGVLAGYTLVDWRTLCGNVFMLQDFSAGKPGVWFDTFCGNGPLWSLSYEWWFYMMFFPVYSQVPARFQLPCAAVISLAGLLTYAWHPNQISLFLLYFILWWTGLELGRTYGGGNTPTFYTQRYSVLVLAGFCVGVTIVTLGLMARPVPLLFGLHPILEIRHFCACFVMLCVGLLWSHFEWRGFSRIFGVFSLIAPISYAVYVFHYPIGAYVLNAHWIPGSFLRLLLAILLTLLVSYLAEVPLQRVITRRTNPRRDGVISRATENRIT